MKHLFDEIVSGGEPVLQRLLAEKAQEDVDLEFKAKDSNRPALTDGDRRTIGKTLSAFANSAGGLLVFGADARPDDRKVDRLVRLSPIDDIDRVMSEVRAFSGHVLLPRHDGIRVEAIPSLERRGSGYLAIYVERSERRPHMSKAPDDGRYYRRAGTNSFAMEHFDIEDAFSRSAVPQLELKVEMLQGIKMLSDGGWKVMIQVGIANVGEVLVRYPYVNIVGCQNATLHGHGYPERYTPRWPVTNDPPGTQLTGTVDHVIHVGTLKIAGHLGVPIKKIDGQFLSYNEPLSAISVKYRIQYGAEGHRGAIAEGSFGPEDLIDAMYRGGYAV